MPHYVTIPVSKLDAILSRVSVSPTDLDVIRDPRSPARFVGVYERREGRDRCVYRARAHKFLELGHFATAKEAARAVVAWYKNQYGEHRWIKAYRKRKGQPWRVVDISRPCVWSTAPGQMDVIGHRAEVFVRGVPVVVERAPGSYKWPSREAAKRAAREYALLRSTDDLVPGMVLWRA